VEAYNRRAAIRTVFQDRVLCDGFTRAAERSKEELSTKKRSRSHFPTALMMICYLYQWPRTTSRPKADGGTKLVKLGLSFPRPRLWVAVPGSSSLFRAWVEINIRPRTGCLCRSTGAGFTRQRSRSCDCTEPPDYQFENCLGGEKAGR
jgi:hypothetical protein